MAENYLKRRLIEGATSFLALMAGAGAAQAQTKPAASPWPEAIILTPNPEADLKYVYVGRPPQADRAPLPIAACEPVVHVDPNTKKITPVMAPDGKQAQGAPNNSIGMCVDLTRSTDPNAVSLLSGPMRGFATATQGQMNRSADGSMVGEPRFNFVGRIQLPGEDGQDPKDTLVNLRALSHRFDRAPMREDPYLACYRTGYDLYYKDMSVPDGKVKIITGVAQYCKGKNGPV